MSFRITNVTAGDVRAGNISLSAGESLVLPQLTDDFDSLVRGKTVEIIDFSNTTRLYDWASGQRIVVGAGSVQSAAIPNYEVQLISTTNCYIAIGPNPTAADAAGSIFLVANERLHLQINPNDKIAVIQASAGGALFILPVRQPI